MATTIRLLSFAILSIFLGAVSLSAQPAQGELSLLLTVKNNQLAPMANTPIEFVETQTRERKAASTNAEGQVEVEFTTGRYWQINVLEIKDYYFWQVEVVPDKSYRVTKTITYDHARYLRESRPAINRALLNLQTEAQKFQPDEAPTATLGIVKLEIKKADNKPLTNFPVTLTCFKLNKTFTTTTNPAGFATFKVPIGNEYEVDIDGIASFQYADLPNKPNARANKSFVYEPTVVDEKTVRDTTRQNLPEGQEGTTGRVLVTITFKGGLDGFWRDEPVYLEVLGDQQWYTGRTNQLGEVRFLLPKGKKYMIHGRYEADIDVIDLTRRRGIGYGVKQVTYRPIEKYQYPERFIPRPEDIIVTAFDNFIQNQYPRPDPANDIQVFGEWGGPVNAQSEEAILRLAVTTTPSADYSKSKPLNVAFVIDKSGSMAGHDRIDQLKLSLLSFVSKLRPQDVVSIVVFNDFETVVIPAKAIGTDKYLLLEAIERVEADGGTQIANGLAAGYKELIKNFKPSYTNRLILLSDGYGSEPVEETLEAQKPYNARGVECTTVGVGESYNYALLKLLATNGGGLIEHIGDAKQIEEVFTRQISSMLHPIGKNLQLEVLYNRHLEYKQLLGFPLAERGAGRLKLKLRDVHAGMDQLALVRFKLLDPKPGIQDEPVILRLQYQDIATGEIKKQETKVPLVWSEEAGKLELLIDQNEKRLYATAMMNQALKVMAEHFHAGNLAGAKAALEDGLASLRKVYPDALEADLEALRAEFEKYLDIIANQ